MEKMMELKNVNFSYWMKKRGVKMEVPVLHHVSSVFRKGEICALMGKSGSGKSTLLALMGSMQQGYEGEILYEGRDIKKIPRKEYLRSDCTMVYQNYRLLPLLTVEENISYPMELQGIPAVERRKRVREYMKKVELPENLLKRLPGMLSGGEQQRVGIARALAVGTRVLLADEPTGNLDRANSDKIIELLVKLAHEDGYCVIIATHDNQIMSKMDYVYRLEEGNICTESDR